MISLEDRGIIEVVRSSGVPNIVTCTTNHPLYASSGSISRHRRPGTGGLGLAVDFAGPKGGNDTDQHAAIFRAFRPYEALIYELIYAGPQVTYNIKAGKRVPKYAESAHHNHVHCAVDLGVFLAAGQSIDPNPWPQGPSPLVVGELLEGNMRPYQIQVELDSEGNGYYDIPNLAKSRVVNPGVSNSADPVVGGYKPNPAYGALQVGAATRITIRGGLPKGRLDFTTWAVE